MAYTPIWIENGITIDASLANVIAISPNGVDWSYIQKSQISTVSPVFIPFAGASPANTAYMSPWIHDACITINLTNGAPIKFDVQNVENQPSWVVVSTQHPSGTAATVQSGQNAAVEQILIWVSST